MKRYRLNPKCCVVAVSLLLFHSAATSPSYGQTALCASGKVCVTTWQQDTGVSDISPGYAYRTGENLSEGTLLYSTPLSASNFLQLCSAQLDGQVYAQPLVVSGAKIGTTTYTYVVYVVSEKDTLYAIDGDPADGNTPCTILNGNGSGTSLLLSGQYPVDCTPPHPDRPPFLPPWLGQSISGGPPLSSRIRREVI